MLSSTSMRWQPKSISGPPPACCLRVNQERNQKCAGVDELLAYHQDMATAREDLPYEIDGVVYKFNRLQAW